MDIEYGLGLEEIEKDEDDKKIVTLEEVKKHKAPYFLWEVNGS